MRQDKPQVSEAPDSTNRTGFFLRVHVEESVYYIECANLTICGGEYDTIVSSRDRIGHGRVKSDSRRSVGDGGIDRANRTSGQAALKPHHGTSGKPAPPTLASLATFFHRVDISRSVELATIIRPMGHRVFHRNGRGRFQLAWRVPRVLVQVSSMEGLDLLGPRSGTVRGICAVVIVLEGNCPR